MDKFKDCATNVPADTYEIDLGNTKATAHTLTLMDRAEIESHTIKWISDPVTRTPSPVPTGASMLILWTVFKALDSWSLDCDITLENVSNNASLAGKLYSVIQAHEDSIAEAMQSNEKN